MSCTLHQPHQANQMYRLRVAGDEPEDQLLRGTRGSAARPSQRQTPHAPRVDDHHPHYGRGAFTRPLSIQRSFSPKPDTTAFTPCPHSARCSAAQYEKWKILHYLHCAMLLHHVWTPSLVTVVSIFCAASRRRNALCVDRALH